MPHNSAAFFLFPDFENKAVSKTVLAENDMLFNKSISRVPADFIDKLRALPKERPCCLLYSFSRLRQRLCKDLKDSAQLVDNLVGLAYNYRKNIVYNAGD